jgi:hypothetical protein
MFGVTFITLQPAAAGTTKHDAAADYCHYLEGVASWLCQMCAACTTTPMKKWNMRIYLSCRAFARNVSSEARPVLLPFIHQSHLCLHLPLLMQHAGQFSCPIIKPDVLITLIDALMRLSPAVGCVVGCDFHWGSTGHAALLRLHQVII